MTLRATLSDPIPAALAVALDLASRGLPVFPCGPDKRPLTPHGFKDASRDARQIEAWWQAYPEALVGLPTGSRSGLYVVDLDIDRATGEALGEGSLGRLGLARLLAGPRVRTPSGGTHLYFRWPARASATPPAGSGQGSTRGAKAATSSRRVPSALPEPMRPKAHGGSRRNSPTTSARSCCPQCKRPNPQPLTSTRAGRKARFPHGPQRPCGTRLPRFWPRPKAGATTRSTAPPSGSDRSSREAGWTGPRSRPVFWRRLSR